MISWGMNQSPSILTDSQVTYPTQLILKTTIYSGSLYLPSHILLPPPHKLARYRYPLFPHEQLIYGTTVHLCRYGVLPLLYILFDWE